ncbi:MAG: carbonic anhydrase [Sediminibacterium sp.]|nr:carbonic anhydrase [Sediminibacterium sp.]
MSYFQFHPLAAALLMIFVFNSIGCSSINKKSEQESIAIDPLQVLLEGNKRFAKMKPVHPDEDVYRLRSVTREQHPFAVIVSCSDSRVSPELIFDQGIGDLFIIRTAGNILGNIGLGSIEYAVEHLHVKLIMVLGHERCGAVSAFVQGEKVPGHIRDIIDSLKQEIEIKAIPYTDPNRLNDCINANVEHGIRQLTTQSEIIREKVEEKELRIVGGIYNLDNLRVKLIHQ